MTRHVEDLLKETAIATNGVKSYGRGLKHFANISDNELPRVWIHQVKPTDRMKFGLMQTEYRIIGEVTKQIDFDADKDGSEFIACLRDIEPIYERLMTNIAKQTEVVEMSDIFRTEIIHQGDHNLCGYAFATTVKIKKQIAQQCQV